MNHNLEFIIFKDQGVPNAPEVQPNGGVTNAEFRDDIQMLSQVVANQAGQQRGNRKDVVDTSRICEFLRINPPDFTDSSVIEDFSEYLWNVFEVMHVADAERVELVAYQLKVVARVWYDQWKKSRVECAPIVSWVMFEETFLRLFCSREVREAKISYGLLTSASITFTKCGSRSREVRPTKLCDHEVLCRNCDLCLRNREGHILLGVCFCKPMATFVISMRSFGKPLEVGRGHDDEPSGGLWG
uniref:Gag-pol polyprotein n=1 Tax=Solanum tuberosum TaxID=4113 RepID=M1DFV2_SOLTU